MAVRWSESDHGRTSLTGRLRELGSILFCGGVGFPGSADV